MKRLFATLTLLAALFCADAVAARLVQPDLSGTEVDYKSEELAPGMVAHLWRLAQDPSGEDLWTLELPMVALIEIDEATYRQMVSEFENQSDEEIIASLREEFANESGIKLQDIQSGPIEWGAFQGYRFAIKIIYEELGIESVLVNSYLSTDDTYWIVNGTALRGPEDIAMMDRIISGITFEDETVADSAPGN